MDAFADVLKGNDAYVRSFRLGDLQPVAARGIAVVTCMDSRIEPLSMLGLKPGDAKILRNAGARVTGDVLRTLVLATHLLGVERVMVVAHTHCKMASASEEEVDAEIRAKSGIDPRSLDFRMVSDQRRVLSRDVQRLRSWPFLPPSTLIGGFMYDVMSGRLTHVA